MSISRLMQMARAGVPSGSAWTDPDLANASYDSVSFSVAGQDTAPQGIFFGDGATKLYVVGDTGNDVNQYSLSTAWDITTASFVQSFSVGSQETTPEGIFFKPDGTKMYICGNASDSVHEYNLSTAWDISTASFSQSLSVTAQEVAPRAVAFKPDGTTMLIGGPATDTILQYLLSTAWDVSTASYVQSFSIASQETILQSMFINGDGTSLMLVGQQGLDVNRYSLSTAWDVSTMSYVENFSISAQDTSPEGLFFKSDGSKMYYCGSNSDTIYQYSTVTPAAPEWTDPDLANASYDSVSFGVNDAFPQGIFFKPDGLKVYMCGTSSDAINEYDLSTAWDISSCSFLQSFSVASQESIVTDLFFKPDGLKVYIIGSSSDTINEYALSTAWDVSTASYVQNFSIASQETNARGLFFSDSGLKLFIVGSINDTVYQYSLSSAWDVSSASYDSKSFSVATQETNPTALFFSPSLDRMFVLGSASDSVQEYALSTAGDVSSASYVQSFSIASQESSPSGIAFKNDGSKMYIIGLGTDAIYQYSTN